MTSIDSTITEKGQVSIPAEVRRFLGVQEGDTITFIVDEESGVRLKAARRSTISSLRGAAGSLPKPLSWEDMRKIAREDYLDTERDSIDA